MLAICHTCYSLQTGVRSPADWAAAAVARGYSALALADINGLYGAVEFYQAVAGAGLQPIVGAQLQLDRDSACIVLATSDAGYRQLCRLLSARHLMTPFSLPHAVAQGGADALLFLARAPGVLRRLLALVPRSNVYVLPRAPTGQRARRLLWDAAEVEELPVASVPEAWLIDESDRMAFDDLERLRGLAGPGPRISCSHPGVLLPNATDWQQAYPDTGVVAEICARCQFEFTFGQPLLPRIQLPVAGSSKSHLRQLCTDALMRKYSGPLQAAAQARLEHELSVISTNGFCDYFLYVHEIIGFARDRRIPVEVRGSAASSIVSYLLGFTHCCPLEHDLYFERFMNPGRRDCPDIDLDIADKRRDEVINFCYDRWGEEHVAMVSTIQRYRPRSAVRDAGRLLGYKPAQVTRILGDEREAQQHSQLFRTAGRLVGLPRHLGVHCGGLIITPCPITDMTPLTRARKGVIITHYEKDQAEAVGLIKMDLLGNSALSVIDEASQWLARRDVVLAEPGPRHDYKVRRLFANGDTLGVYQCESPGMRQLCRALVPGTQKEVATALSLIRPGPAAAGMKDAFIRRRRRLEPVTYLHPKMAKFLGATYGVMLYQEDVMKVAVNLAGYSLGDADSLRRAVKSRDSAAFNDERNRFIFEKAAAVGVDPAVAQDIWQQVTQFASYSYCKAHASVYGRLAWLTARLKAHYPREFYTAILNCHKSMYARRVFVWDALRRNIPVLPPEINFSDLGWIPVRRGIRAGLDIIKGLRQSVCRQLINQRRCTPFRDLADLCRRVDFQAGELERLILIGACRSLGTREALLEILHDAGRYGRQPTLFALDQAELPELLHCELDLTGIPFSAHPTEHTGTPATCHADEMQYFVNRPVEMVGILDAVKYLQVKPKTEDAHEREMSFVTLEDETGTFELVLFPETHREYARLFSSLGPYCVRGTVSEKWDSLSLEVAEVAV